MFFDPQFPNHDPLLDDPIEERETWDTDSSDDYREDDFSNE